LPRQARFGRNIPHFCHPDALLAPYPEPVTSTDERLVMDVKRKIAMAAATLAVAFGAGHLLVNGPEQRVQATAPQDIVTLPASLNTDVAPMMPAAAALAQVAFTAPAPTLPKAASLVKTSAVILTQTLQTPKKLAPACPLTLDVMAGAQATLNLTLIAPCRTTERVVIRHGGLAVTALTSATGTLFTSIPGFDTAGEVSVLFSDGIEILAAKRLGDLSAYRRFAVQWVDADTFQLHAFENGAQFGAGGHVSAATPGRQHSNVPMTGGYLSLLGNPATSLPMLAEVYTFPKDRDIPVDLTVEAMITDATCNRELLGEVLLSENGAVTETDLTMAMPDCNAIGDVLVLNNPQPDLKLATAN
jgi:hypothetical protein